MDIVHLELKVEIAGVSHFWQGIPGVEPPPWMQEISLQEEGGQWQLTLHPRGEITLRGFYLTLRQAYPQDTRVLVNGYQTWTESREYTLLERLPNLNRWVGPINRHYRFSQYGDYRFTDYSGEPGCFHSYAWIYLRQGEYYHWWLSEDESVAYTRFRTYPKQEFLVIEKDVDGLVLTEPLRLLAVRQAVTTTAHVLPGSPFPEPELPSTGWTSWYRYYTQIDQSIIQANVRAFQQARIPLDYFQIDDGYQQAVGDWEPNAKFSAGMASLATAIRAAGYEPGLWLAPFICEEKSSLRREHPDWIARDATGNLVEAGFSPGWSGRFYALDLSQEAVRAFVRKTLQRISGEWGFGLIKLDFLYAAALAPPVGKTRAQAMRAAMELVREAVPAVRLLGCGVPLASARGLVDFCRVSADVGLIWEDWRLADLIRYRERVSTKSALRSTLARFLLDGQGFRNDPDVFIMRDTDQKMTWTQRLTLFRVNQVLGSLLFTSDALADYSPAIAGWYRRQFPVFPRQVTELRQEGEGYRVSFAAAGGVFVLAANLGKSPMQMPLPPGEWFADGKVVTHDVDLAPYASIILRQFSRKGPVLLGSDGHLFPGADVTRWQFAGNQVTLVRHNQAIPTAMVHFWVPDLKPYQWNGVEYHPTPLAEGGLLVLPDA
ncbi:MAG: alpha-galactosidase [Lewinellaceae bacterium]|nr:alpha-galactosidase [Lewinellaceae bacterium]